MFIKSSLTVSAACAAFLLGAQRSPAAEIPPLKALLIAGGCCHDYAKQKDILKRGIEQRANLRSTSSTLTMAAPVRSCRSSATRITPRVTT
jgi:hypothetical protein